MRLLKITRWELKNTLFSKKFIMIFVLQFAVLILMMGAFNSFITSIESENGISISPSLSGFASIDLSDNSTLLIDELNREVLNVKELNYNDSFTRLEDGEISAVIVMPENSAEQVERFQSVNVNLYMNPEDPKQAVVLKEVNSSLDTLSTSISEKWIDSLIPSDKIINTNVKEEKKGESLPLQLITKMMIVVLLFLPLFLFGNMVIDSIVGEKERKTGEILIAMPLSHSDIIMGKSLAIILTIALQVAIWILILLAAGFNIENPVLVYAALVLASVPIIGITSVVAAYSKNYKEAGIGLSFIYIIIVGFFIVPTLAYISNGTKFSNISPMTLVMRLFSGENMSTTDLLIPIFSVIMVSVISFWISIKLFKRDDVVFGPRPSILRIIMDFSGIKKRSFK